MAKMSIAEKRETARAMAAELVTIPEGAELAGQNAFAVPVEVNGEEIWVLYTATVPQWYDTAKTKAFDPFAKQAEWEGILDDRAARKADQEKKKADKIARQEAKRTKKA